MDSSVAVASAYMRLNGYFVLNELPVQVADREGYRTATDLDILAVRLPHAAELVPTTHGHAREMLLGQDPTLDIDPSRTDVLVAEVKRGRGRVNRGYHDPAVLRFALRRTGCCASEMIGAHAAALAREGAIQTVTEDGHRCRIRLASFAGELGHVSGSAVSIDLAHCAAFIRARLETYRAQLRGAYFRDPVLNLLGLLDSFSGRRDLEKEIVHAS